MDANTVLQPIKWTFRRVMWATIVFVFVALGFWLLYRFHAAFFVLFVSIVMGTAMRPAVARLYSFGVPRRTGVLLVYLLLLALLIAFVFLLFPVILEEGATIVAQAPVFYQGVREWMVTHPNVWIVRLSRFLPMALPGLESAPQTGEEVLASSGQALGYIASAAKVILIATAILLLAFHWTLDGPRAVQVLLNLIPKGQRESIGELIAIMETRVGFYIAGQGVLGVVIGVMALVAYLLIGLPNALVLALVAGVMELVPMIGPLIGAVPAAIVALSIAPSKFAWVIVATLVIQQLENSILVPRVMRRAVGVNPFVTLLAIFAFTSLFGIAGALMAIPIAAILQVLLNRFVFNREAKESDGPEGRDFASRLRYEAQDLADDLRGQARLSKSGTDLWVKQTDQVMDEIEAITTDLDSLLAQVANPGAS
ncbi:MAG TPA: AI-2E family transporter [Anaerolineales bacterium]|nr:AI-2E family transporter [Anaerolineales bacterium]